MLGVDVPLVYRNIGDPNFWNPTRLRRWRTRLLLTRASRIVALTPEARRRFRALGVDPVRVSVIPNGVDVERFPMVEPVRRAGARADFGLAADEGVAVYVGALAPEKNVGAVVRALTKLDGVKLLVAGEGSERTALERLGRALAPDRVQFLGRFDDVPRVFAAADVVVLPSLSEGLPGVLIEAGLSGIPVVASDVGFVNEVVADGETGYLVDPADGPGLADALARAINAHETLGAAARARCIARFDLKKVAADWAGVLDDVVRQKAGAG
jgi:glycosyltransferase involved in cell wall biosynthesis